MRTASSLTILMLLAGALPLASQTGTIVERGPHHAVVQTVRFSLDPRGRSVLVTNHYTLLETGLHRRDETGRWVETSDRIEVFPEGLIARGGVYSLVVSPNLNSAGAIDLLTSEGLRLRSHLIGLAYVDPATGASVLIGGVKDAVAELIEPNVILFRDVLDGVAADYRIVYRRSGFEADVILRAQLPGPEEWGLPSTVELVVLTEFLSPPTPREFQALTRMALRLGL